MHSPHPSPFGAHLVNDEVVEEKEQDVEVKVELEEVDVVAGWNDRIPHNLHNNIIMKIMLIIFSIIL